MKLFLWFWLYLFLLMFALAFIFWIMSIPLHGLIFNPLKLLAFVTILSGAMSFAMVYFEDET